MVYIGLVKEKNNFLVSFLLIRLHCVKMLRVHAPREHKEIAWDGKDHQGFQRPFAKVKIVSPNLWICELLHFNAVHTIII